MVISFADIVGPELAAELRQTLRQAGDPGSDCQPGALALIGALAADPLFRLGVQPKAFAVPRLQHHRPADPTVDRAFTRIVQPALVDGVGSLIRADVSICVFLSEPTDYEGGELIIDSGFGNTYHKEPLGACVAFPASSAQSVAPVTAGNRWTAMIHVQSLMRGSAERQIIYDVGCAAYFLEVLGRGDSEEALLLSQSREQLLRMWSEL